MVKKFFVTTALVAIFCASVCGGTSFAFGVLSGDVDPKIVTGVELSEPEIDVPEGGMKKLKATVLPETALNKKVTWYSNDESIAKVSANGVVEAVSRGTCSVGVVTEEGEFVDECVVNVTRNDDPFKEKVTGLILDADELEIVVGQERRIYADVVPDTALNKNVIWTSSNAKVVSVKDGLVRAVGAGSAIVTASSEDGGYSDTCVIKVEEDYYGSGGGCNAGFGVPASILLAVPLLFIGRRGR